MSRGLRRIAVIWGLFLVLLALPSRLGAHTNTDRDTVSLRFRLDNAELDLSYADNARNWQRFEQRFRAEYGNRNPICIQFDVYAGASPEGSRNRNLALGQARAEAIAAYLRERLGERAGTIELHNLGPRWDDLYDLVAASDEPWRDEVLQIIKARVKADPRWLDPREMRLRKLHDGLVWPELEEKYLAPLRSGISGAVVVSWHPERDTLVIRDTVVIEKREVIVHENYCRPETVAPARRVR